MFASPLMSNTYQHQQLEHSIWVWPPQGREKIKLCYRKLKSTYLHLISESPLSSRHTAAKRWRYCAKAQQWMLTTRKELDAATSQSQNINNNSQKAKFKKHKKWNKWNRLGLITAVSSQDSDGNANKMVKITDSTKSPKTQQTSHRGPQVPGTQYVPNGKKIQRSQYNSPGQCNLHSCQCAS